MFRFSSAGFRIARRYAARLFIFVALVIHLLISTTSRTAVTAARVGILVRSGVSRWWIPIFWSLVSALLWLRLSLLNTGIMTFARFWCFLVWPGVWRFRAVVVVNHHSLPSVAHGLRIQLRGAAEPGSAISSTSGHKKAPFKDKASRFQSITRKIDMMGLNYDHSAIASSGINKDFLFVE
ncbi:hypothetical protein [Pseudomonas sp. EA_5y_Pfl2_R50]|uniref:hypothetical protein n=1 Tax=Pseudomonas sp. EA_5y_Pfl2_R50 TaxID=3088691 RepID=UPI0030D8E000